MANMSHIDVVVIGAGISGIDAGYHIKTRCPDKTFAILERRADIGGTWDLFQYPGIRSDSDMFTLGFGWKPWKGKAHIAPGAEIKAYLKEAAEEQGLMEHIRVDHGVTSASWSTPEAKWTLTFDNQEPLTCSMLVMCAGYYNYDEGYKPKFKGITKFKGEVVHPQEWNPSVDYKDKKVVVIGSGATAITLVPTLAEQASHVTMLQRSPTYIVPDPIKDVVADNFILKAVLPDGARLFLARWYHIVYYVVMYFFCVTAPFSWVAKWLMIRWMRNQLPKMSQKEFDANWIPRYMPWEQRPCLSPGGDFFAAIRNGTADVVTNHIDSFTKEGIRLAGSGEVLAADLIVTATGLVLPTAADAGKYMSSGIKLFKDGEKILPPDQVMWNGVMVTGVPNCVYILGYVNASWTLKADLVSSFVCRLLQHMDQNKYDACVPALDGEMELVDGIPLQSGYFRRCAKFLPKQGLSNPWRSGRGFLGDLLTLQHGSMHHPSLRYTPSS